MSENNDLYDKWNSLKKNIKGSNVLFREKDVWWCKLGKNIGQEQNGLGENFSRPVLILRKLDAKTCIVLPLTSQESVGSWFFELPKQGGKRSWVMLNQIKLISSDRLYFYIGYVGIFDFSKIKKRLASLLKLF